jgi:hypothetical protein
MGCGAAVPALSRLSQPGGHDTAASTSRGETYQRRPCAPSASPSSSAAERSQRRDCVDKAAHLTTVDAHTCERTGIIGMHIDGVFAEYMAAPQDICVKLPDHASLEVGALLEAASERSRLSETPGSFGWTMKR